MEVEMVYDFLYSFIPIGLWIGIIFGGAYFNCMDRLCPWREDD